MGLFSKLFESRKHDDDSPQTKVKESNEDRSKVVADRFTKTEDNKHVHESYTLDRASGSYKEYRGGENSSDRSYNRSDSDKGDKGAGKK